jgi:hypothetical protein
MPDSDYSFEGEDGSEEEYVGSRAAPSRAPSSTRTQDKGKGKQRAKEDQPPPKRHAWETEDSRTVAKTIAPADDGSLGQSVQEREEERKRKRLRKDTKPFQRGIIRHVVLVLDLSEAMLEKDMRPNRYITMINYAQDYVREFFEQNPISQMSVLGMHDGVCIRVSEQRYKDYGARTTARSPRARLVCRMRWSWPGRRCTTPPVMERERSLWCLDHYFLSIREIYTRRSRPACGTGYA